MAYIKTFEYEEAEAELKNIYDEILKTRGKIAEVHKIQSLNPPTIKAHMDFYLSIMFGNSPLSRAQREMIGVITSSKNKCTYCTKHHSNALNHYWKDHERINKLIDNHRLAGLSEKEILLCDYTVALTKEPGNSELHKKLVEKMKAYGINEREILDTALITGYFNFVNRVVHGLGAELEEDEGEGYKY